MNTFSACMIILALGVALVTVSEPSTSAQVGPRGGNELEARVNGTVREAGTLTSANPLELPCLVPGGATILSIVPSGSSVQKGDLLVELDGSPIEEQVQKQQIVTLEAEAESQQASTLVEITKLQGEAAMAETRAALLQKETSTALAEIELEISSLEKQLATLKKKRDLIQKEQSRNSDTFQLQLMLLDLETEVDIITAKLKHLNSNVLPVRQQQQNHQTESAEQQLKLQTLKSESNLKQAQADLEARKIVARVEQQKLEALHRTLESSRIVAPRDGVVVHAQSASRRADPASLEVGATVRERQVLLLMPDLEHLQMNVRVHESKIARVKTGQSATISFDALPNQKFQGKVIAIADTPLPGAWPNLDVKLYEVIVSLEKLSPSLKLGMTGIAEIDVTKEE